MSIRAMWLSSRLLSRGVTGRPSPAGLGGGLTARSLHGAGWGAVCVVGWVPLGWPGVVEVPPVVWCVEEVPVVPLPVELLLPVELRGAKGYRDGFGRRPPGETYLYVSV